MTKKFTPVFIIGLMAVLSSFCTACYYDKEEVLYPDLPCDTTRQMSYSSDVVPVLSVNCYNCHSLVNAPIYGEGLVLEGYANLRTYLFENPDVLLNSIKQNGQALAMPRGSSKLDKCSISDIEVWIKQGQKNN
jgi:aspartyl aminopeptidase